MATKSLPKMDFNAIGEKIQSQFRGLNPNDPASWPIIPRAAICLALAIGIVVVLWFVWLNGSADQLEAEQKKELALREDYKKKLTQAVNLDALKKQREQVQQYVTQLEKQLPSKAEMDALLSDINQAGLGRSLHFELFKPGLVSVKEYYAELPIALKVTGRYHDVGAFASDIAHLSRIVTLNNLSIGPPPGATAIKDPDQLVLEATAKTFRYLDKDEVAAQAKATASGAKK
ncbi:MAG TPA: type 4a pilus biogenesis protein PilO [Ramlibacter sp.]|uniref:type 4a pilus biogenesis protein PilO n=1 Tax=Ramlibacter sp. TaxID=1917967 RepID=UPI002CADC7B3|nr:type 4a pilus biogenesis protein PilO [Ramlibacter sp.]HVZ42388.1 type 4a pilus biogenesis protein PilO [Ramlibacter sp.]